MRRAQDVLTAAVLFGLDVGNGRGPGTLGGGPPMAFRQTGPEAASSIRAAANGIGLGASSGS
jgi:hypothetical protein